MSTAPPTLTALMLSSRMRPVRIACVEAAVASLHADVGVGDQAVDLRDKADGDPTVVHEQVALTLFEPDALGEQVEPVLFAQRHIDQTCEE